MTDILIIAGALAMVFASGWWLREIGAAKELGLAELRLIDQWNRESRDLVDKLNTVRAQLNEALKNNEHQASLISGLVKKVPSRDQAGRFVKKA